MEEQQGQWHLATQIAVGIVAAAVVIFIGFHLYLALVVGTVGAAAKQATQQIQASSEEAMARIQGRYAAQRAQAEQQRKREKELELAQRRQDAQRLQAAANQARVDAAEAQAKDEAWRRFYQPSKKCDSPPDWDTQVECGNAYVRAKKEFEAKWAGGELR